MPRIFTVEQRGIGKPDYSKEVSAGRQRAGISLKYNQSLRVFALICTDEVAHPYDITWVKDLIAIGGTSRLIDVSTGDYTPYTLPAGYTLNMIQKHYHANQDIEIYIYYDGYIVVMPALQPAGAFAYANMVVPYNTITLDPTAASSHQIDSVIFNRGEAALRGAFTFVAVIEAIGTEPLPTTKDCRCPFCNHIQTVKVGTTVITCDNCGKTYYVQDFSHIREL